MNAITTQQPARARAVGPVLQPQSFQELVRFAEMAAGSDLMPRDYKGKPANIMLAVQMGSELGLSPMQAVQNIAVVNGRPSVWGDALLGLVRNSPKCQDVAETITGEGDARTATCIVKRVGASDTVRSFSVADAKKASLWGKQGPWQQYPDRMLAMRARGFACRDAFPDVLKGLISAEEAQDIPADTFQGTTIQTTAEPTPQPTQPARSENRRLTFMERVDVWLGQCKAVADVDAVENKPMVQQALSEAPHEVVHELNGKLAAKRAELDGADAGEQADDLDTMPE